MLDANRYHPVFVNYGGAGHHVEVVTPEQMETWLKLIIAEEFLYVLCATMPKMVILCLYQRIFPTKPYRYATYFIGGVMVANYVIDIVLALATYIPVVYSWDKTTRKNLRRHCGRVPLDQRSEPPYRHCNPDSTAPRRLESSYFTQPKDWSNLYLHDRQHVSPSTRLQAALFDKQTANRHLLSTAAS